MKSMFVVTLSFIGLMMIAMSASWTTYEESKMPTKYGSLYVAPSGGEHFDIEAMYFGDDAHYAYFAIITSMSEDGYYFLPHGHTFKAGDLALDLDRDSTTGEYGYEYGIKLIGPEKGQICLNPDWSLPDANTGFPSNAPSEFTCPFGHVVGNASVVYVNAGTPDHGADNYIIKISVHKSYIGNPTKGQLGDFHVAMSCGNDVIELNSYQWDYPAPEFPMQAIPAVIFAISPLFGYIIARRRESEKLAN